MKRRVSRKPDELPAEYIARYFVLKKVFSLKRMSTTYSYARRDRDVSRTKGPTRDSGPQKIMTRDIDRRWSKAKWWSPSQSDISHAYVNRAPEDAEQHSNTVKGSDDEGSEKRCVS
jgi:hypothetical protein